MHHIRLSAIRTFYNRHVIQFMQFICNLIILYKSSFFVHDLLFSSEPFFSHKFESQDYVPSVIVSEHVFDQQAPL
jgi:hypothetical protein